MEVEISFKVLLKTLYKHLAIIIVATLLIAILVAMYTLFLVTPIYRATATSTLLITDLNATQGSNLNTTITMMSTYVVKVKSDETMALACSRLNNVYTPEELRKMVTVQYEEGGTVMYISAVSTSPVNAKIIANVVTESAKYTIDTVDWEINNAAIEPTSPASPSLVTNVILGTVIGFVLVYGICLLADIYNTKIINEDHLAQSLDVPVLGVIPLVETTSVVAKPIEEVKNDAE